MNKSKHIAILSASLSAAAALGMDIASIAALLALVSALLALFE